MVCEGGGSVVCEGRGGVVSFIILLAQKRQQLLATSGDVAMMGSQLLVLVGEQEVDQGTQDALVAMAKAVATATAALVTNAK